jgi:glycerol-3-phosphate acyltransferase PlsY
MMDLLVKILLAYMLGSVSGSMVMGAFRNVDIRESGSGNAGATNALRILGPWFALAVIVIDVGKGFLAAWLFPHLDMAALGKPVSMELQMLACGFAAVVGHCYPVWHGFRGGKGAATAVGALIMIEPTALLIIILTWLIVLVLSGLVGLATMLAAISVIPTFIWLDVSAETFWFGILMVAFIIFTHRSNIVNIRNGAEYKFERIRIINWFR